MPLANHITNILIVMLGRCLVQVAFGFEIANTEGNATVLKSMSENRYKPIGVTSIIKGNTEFLYRVAVTGVLKASPFFRLGRLDKVDKSINIETHGRVVCIGGFGVAALFG